MATINFYRFSDLSTQEREKLLERSSMGSLEPYIEKVRPIIEAVKTRGDEAIVEFAKTFDKANIGTHQIR